MKGLAPHTLQVFEAVSKLDCIKSYLLVGGTALSLQMGTRQNEDLDFMKWHTSKTEKMEVAWYQIGTFIKYYKISQLIHTQSIAN